MSVADPDGKVGLCATCRHARRVDNRRGSVFFLCERSSTDPLYTRYPRLPVLRCAGFEPDDNREAGSDG